MYPVNFSAFMTEEDTLHAIGETRRILEDIYQCWEKQGTPALKNLEHPLLSDIDPGKSHPIVLLSASNGHAWHFIAEACRNLNVIGIIDNYRVGQVECGISIGADESLYDLKRQHPSLVTVNLAVGPAGILHFRALAAHAGVPCLERPEGLRKLSIHPTHFSEHEIGEKTIPMLPALVSASLGGGLADRLSELTSLRVLLYRITLRREFAWSVCIGMEQNIYCPSIFNYTDNETLVDGGAFTGDTISPFLKIVGGWYNRIYAFEPDSENYAELYKALGKLPRTYAYMKGLAAKAETLRFSSHGSPGSHLDEQGTSEIKVVALDETVDEAVTFFKLNVEGAEVAALEGAKRTISTHRPKIAASVDHLPDDLITIPEKIRGIESGYDIFIRHHSNEYWGAYLYARPKS
ncbi:MAG: FkbM family methyltransferase [Pseudomonadota bacterium]